MKLLLAECVARDLKEDLAAHEVTTVTEAGYQGMKNGALLRAAATQYDVLITVDRNLAFQQNIRSLQIAILVIVAGGITYDNLKPFSPRILEALGGIQPGEVVTVTS